MGGERRLVCLRSVADTTSPGIIGNLTLHSNTASISAVAMVKPLSLACEACRRRKAKCSGAPGPCSNCDHSQLDCIFPTAVKVRSTPRRSSRRIDELDDRLRRIEALLSDVVQSKDQSGVSARLELRGTFSRTDVVVNAPLSQPAPTSHLTAESDHASSYAPIAPQPPPPPTTYNTNPSGIDLGTLQTTSSSTTRSLNLSLQEIEEHFRHYFTTANNLLPLFEESTITTCLQECASDFAHRDPVQWAAVNVVFALSHQSKAMQIADSTIDHNVEALAHVKNAMSVLGDLSMTTTTLLSAQALVGMAKVWQSTYAPQNANMILAIAVRQIHHLKLHKRDTNNDTENDEWRHRLLWIAYTLDKDCSLRCDHPPAFDDKNMDFTLLPSWNPTDGLGFLYPTTDKPRIDYFRLHTNLSIIQSKIQQRLEQVPSTPNVHQNGEDDTPPPPPDAICDLISLLQTWKQQIPAVFQPVPLLRNFSQTSIIALVTLYLRYFNCMSLVHRRAYWNVGHLEAYKRSHEEALTNPCPSHKMCYVAARVSLQLLTVLPQGDVPCIRLLMDHFVSAALILLTGIIYESPLNTGWDDYHLVEPVIENLEVCAQKGDVERLTFIRANLMELQNAARVMLEQIEARGWGVTREGAHKALSPTECHWLYPSNPVDQLTS